MSERFSLSNYLKSQGRVPELLACGSLARKDTQRISLKFTELTRRAIGKAIVISNLPDDVVVVHPDEEFPRDQRFVVITFGPSEAEGLRAYREGALKYTTMDFDPKELSKGLSLSEPLK